MSWGAPVWAQAKPAAVPVTEVEAEKLSALSGRLTVVELFSSQACVFCPKADALLGDIIQNDNIIGLACHVDYFDVRKGSLSRPFCTERQNIYEATLRAGPNFTPQVIINGAYDVIGYKLEEVSNAVHKAAQLAPEAIKIEKLAEKDKYLITLPAVKSDGPLNMQVLFIDQQHTVKIAEGSNRGKTMTYHNIVSRVDHMTDWNGKARVLKIKLGMGKRHKGFVILAAEDSTQHILAAGQYKRPVPQISK